MKEQYSKKPYGGKPKFDPHRNESGEKKKYNGQPNRVGRDRAGYGQKSDRRGDDEMPSNIVVGRNAVAELVKSGAPVDKILVSGREGSVLVIIAEARAAGIPVIDTTADSLDRLSHGEHHQGIAAMVAEKEYVSVDEILKIAEERGEKPLIVICDGVEDPHNLGAIIRCAECAGAHGVIIPARRACGLTPAVSKASAGAILHMAIAKATNIAQTVEYLKEKGIWTFAAEADGEDFFTLDWNTPCAIVMGGEDSGVSRLVRETCDYTVSIPMYGKVNSLNVSTAASVLLCHAARMQRTIK